MTLWTDRVRERIDARRGECRAEARRRQLLALVAHDVHREYQLTPAETEILAAIVAHADGDGLCRVSARRLADVTGRACVNNVRRIRDTLVSLGVIVRVDAGDAHKDARTGHAAAFRATFQPPGEAAVVADVGDRSFDAAIDVASELGRPGARPAELPLPLFEATAMRLASFGLSVELDRDKRVARVAMPDEGGAAHG